MANAESMNVQTAVIDRRLNLAIPHWKTYTHL